MATRVISARSLDDQTCQHKDVATFSSNKYADKINTTGAYCTGGEVVFSKFMGWGKSYYLIVYIDGVEAFETNAMNDQQSSSHETRTYIDTSESYDQSALLSGSGIIEVEVRDNTSPYTDDVCSFREGCDIEINASYCYPTLSINKFTVSQTTDGMYSVSWGSTYSPTDIGDVLYKLTYGSSGTVAYSGKSTSTTIKIPDASYGQSVKFTLTATFCNQTATSSKSFTAQYPSVSAPVLTINDFEGQSVLLSWTNSSVVNATGIISYDLYMNNALYAERVTSPYTIGEDIASTWDAAVDFYVKATASELNNTINGSSVSSDSNTVQFTYLLPIETCDPPNSIALSATLSTQPVHLSWEGSSGGNNNSIIGYCIQWSESSDGEIFGEWNEPGEIVSSSPSLVSPPDTIGNYYKFRIRTLGSAGDEYVSEWFEDSNILLRRDMNVFTSFTDPQIIAGTTIPRAIHMTELFQLVNGLLQFHHAEASTFDNIVAYQTSLLDWKYHIVSIRAAVDRLEFDHDEWLEIPNGLPSANVVTQIREILYGYYQNRNNKE